MKLKVWALGFACGIVWGLTVFLATIIRVLQGQGGRTLYLLGVYYWGYNVSWSGAFAGLVWGFANGLIAGVVLALIYNALSKEKQK